MSDLARRLVEHPRWPRRWPEPMVDDEGFFSREMHLRRAVPDINHPATKGWLLEMLREAARSVEVRVERWNDGSMMRFRSPNPYGGPFWQVEVMGPHAHAIVARRDGTTEGEALAAALLAVWGEP